MQDLFGQDIQVYRGEPVENNKFTEAESELILEEVVFEGLLLKQMAETLAKLKKVRERKTMNLARREAWEEFMWIFDLWHTPAFVSFETACDLAGADSELIRGAISHEFADEIKLFFQSVVTRQPEERVHLINKLRHYIDLREEMH